MPQPSPEVPYYLARHNAALHAPRPPNFNDTPNVEALVVAMLRLAGDGPTNGHSDVRADVMREVDRYKRAWPEPDYVLDPAFDVIRRANSIYPRGFITAADVATAWVRGFSNYDLGRLDGALCDRVFRRHLPASEQ